MADLTTRVDNLCNRILNKYSGKRILIIAHNRTNYAIRATLEGWDFKRFVKEHDQAEFYNCGVAVYNSEGQSDKMELVQNNLKLWED